MTRISGTDFSKVYKENTPALNLTAKVEKEVIFSHRFNLSGTVTGWVGIENTH
jgi:hypothetical protein